MADLRKLTILHSNDMHGDFLAESVDDKLVGGVSLLSGYLNKVRSEEENVIYAIAGDMFRGSVIDSEFKGVSTIEIMNMLSPDVATLGNHETDYGIAHLLFLEKCARFPMQEFHFKGKAEFIGITDAEAESIVPCKVVTTCDIDVLDEYLSHQELVKVPEEPRWVRRS